MHCTPALCDHGETVKSTALWLQTLETNMAHIYQWGLLERKQTLCFLVGLWEQKSQLRQQRSPQRIQTVPSKKDKQHCDAKSKHALTTQERSHAEGRQHALVRHGLWRKKLKTHSKHDLSGPGVCVWLIFSGMGCQCNCESLTSTYISKILISPVTLSCKGVPVPSLRLLFSLQQPVDEYICETVWLPCMVHVILTMVWTEWWVCWGFFSGGGWDVRGVSMEAASHGKSSQQASKIPWCPASRPKWPIRHVYSSPPPSADAALSGPDGKRWQLRGRLISVTIKT